IAAPAMLEVRSEAGSEFFVALNMILIYLNIMLIYFLVLFYGQGVANCVIMEKTSKLMDTFLVSVRPKAMIAGKMLAVFCAAVLQFVSWIVALVLGIVIGGVVASSLHPGQAFSIGAILSALNGGEQLFSAGAVPVAVIMIFAGFLLYCSLAAICGSLASKPEDLSTTLTAFSLVLIASFFCTLYSGLLDGGIKAGMTWLDIVPFTSILVTPARMLLGQVSVLQGTISLVIVLAVAAAFVIVAGRLYKLMAMYKGNPPKLKQLIKMIKA
ncbi:MAG: ABC transporter permease, partial [Oscillospiraceae bacterium]|nr:ABC transporter permease [Oscillospiraceae bacterium]